MSMGRSVAFRAFLTCLTIWSASASTVSRSSSLRGMQEACSFPLQFHVNETQPPSVLSLGIAVRSSTGDSTEFFTGNLSWKANTTTNVTFPLLPCGASIYGILVRVAQGGMDDRQGPTPGQLLVDSVDGYYNGRYKTSAPSDDGYLIYWGKVFIPFGRIPM